MTRADHHLERAVPNAARTSDCWALIDAHVHLHPRYELSAMFDQAATNVIRAARRMSEPGQPVGVLLLAESGGVDRFGELMRRLGQMVGCWHVLAFDENESLHLMRTTGQRLILIAGRQIVTHERLEVLALGTRRRIDDGQPVEAVVDAVRRAGALPVLPWGLGKWFGQRGEMVRRLLESSLADVLFLGDNGGRPRHWPTPALFELARRRGVRVLPGTDPLPLARQQHRAGRYGFVLPLAADERHPFHSIRDALLHQPGQPPTFGRRDGWLAFTAAQLAMHWRLQRNRWRS